MEYRVITQEQLDQISDSFGSTFAILGPNVLGNLFSPDEMSAVNGLIRKYIPKVKDVIFTQQQEVARDYYVWAIEIVCQEHSIVRAEDTA